MPAAAGSGPWITGSFMCLRPAVAGGKEPFWGRGVLELGSRSSRPTIQAMAFGLALLIYVGVYLASQRWLGDIFTAYTRACITLLLSPAVLFCAAALSEWLAGRGSALAGLMATAVFGLPLFLLALVGLFLGALIGWARMGARAGVGDQPGAELGSDATCPQCGHPLAAHRLSDVKPVHLQCGHAGCGCVTHSQPSNDQIESSDRER